MKTYLFKYRYENDEYVLEMTADSLAEAEARIHAAAMHRTYLGIREMKIPAGFGGGWLVKAWCVARNFFAS